MGADYFVFDPIKDTEKTLFLHSQVSFAVKVAKTHLNNAFSITDIFYYFISWVLIVLFYASRADLASHSIKDKENIVLSCYKGHFSFPLLFL